MWGLDLFHHAGFTLKEDTDQCNSNKQVYWIFVTHSGTTIFVVAVLKKATEA